MIEKLQNLLYFFFSFRLTSALQELGEEKQLGKALRYNQQQWQNKINKYEEKYNELKANSEKEIKELKENLRDVMFHIEAQQVIDKAADKEDIASGTITVGENVQKSNSKTRSRRKR